ncbi:hypothetical protein Ciccas_012277 [Cichlidogyrus casuarinus]|uniref:Uncharacterized protein n=1 Tax=Cichlidogyrus casuarinus TaxID=1844966 RepID=A0ABD2PR49_9PLAT
MLQQAVARKESRGGREWSEVDKGRIVGRKERNLFAGLPKLMLTGSVLEHVMEKDDPLYMLTQEWKAREGVKQRLQRRVQERLRYGWDVHLPEAPHGFFQRNLDRVTSQIE